MTKSIGTTCTERKLRMDPELRTAVGRLSKEYAAQSGDRNREAFFFSLRMEIIRAKKDGA